MKIRDYENFDEDEMEFREVKRKIKTKLNIEDRKDQKRYKKKHHVDKDKGYKDEYDED